MTAVYVIALIDETVTLPRIAGRKLEVLPIGDVYAVVEKRSDSPVLSEETLRQQHELVARIAQRSSAVLPARFGSSVTPKELAEIVSIRGTELRQAFDLVRHREQMTIRLLSEVGPPEKTAAGPTAKTSGTEYLQARRAETVRQGLPADVRDLIAVVRPWVKAERIEPGGDRMRTALYHLIERGRSEEYRRALESTRLADASRLIRVSGPWPPFAFAPDLRP